MRLLQGHGLAAARVPLSGIVEGRFRGDISVPASTGISVAKPSVAATVSTVFMTGSRGREFLVLRADRKPTLVVVKLELAAEVVMAAERSKGATP